MAALLIKAALDRWWRCTENTARRAIGIEHPDFANPALKHLVWIKVRPRAKKKKYSWLAGYREAPFRVIFQPVADLKCLGTGHADSKRAFQDTFVAFKGA